MARFLFVAANVAVAAGLAGFGVSVFRRRHSLPEILFALLLVCLDPNFGLVPLLGGAVGAEGWLDVTERFQAAWFASAMTTCMSWHVLFGRIARRRQA